MKYRYVIVIALIMMTLSGCGNNNKIEDNNNEIHSDLFTKINKVDDTTEKDNSILEEDDNTNTDTDAEIFIRDPEDFRIDTEQKTPDEQMKIILTANENYINSKGLSLSTLINMEWEYREDEGTYRAVAFDGSDFHGVVVNIIDNTMEIDPQ